MEIDQRLVDAATTILRGGNAKVHKSTRSGFTTSAIIAAGDMGKLILCIVPTNRISEETVSNASGGSLVSVRANSGCLMREDEIKNDKFLAKLPWPLLSCEDCFHLGTCPVTRILASHAPVVVVTYSKLMALMLSKSNTAKRILKKLSSTDIVLMDEAHMISLPTVARVLAFTKIEIPEGYPNLAKILSKWFDLNDVNKQEIEQMEEEGNRSHVGRILSKRISNHDPLTFRQLSAASNELLDLAKHRKELYLQEKDILTIRDIIALLSGLVINLTYVKDGSSEEGTVFLTGNYWISIRTISEFLSKNASKAAHIYVSGTLIEPYQDFFSNLSGKHVHDAIFPDIRNTNDKMTIYYDTWKLNSHNFLKYLDRIVDKIIEICTAHAEDEVYVIAPNSRYAVVIGKRLKEILGEAAPPVDFYRSDRTIGVENSARTCIAIGLAELPSNTYDHQAIGGGDEERWLDSQRLRQESVHSATWQTWSRVKDPAGKQQSAVYCIGVREKQVRDVVSWGPGRLLELKGIKNYQLPDGIKGRTPVFEVTVSEPIKPPKIAATGPGGGRRGASYDIGQAVEAVENYDPTLIISEFGSILPININRQNVSKVGIYNNPRDKIERNSTAASLTALFTTRFDCYALQDKNPDKSGRYGYCRRSARWDNDPKVMMDHVEGRTTVALYQIGLDDKLKWICFDIDDHKSEKGADSVRAEVLRLLAVLNKHGIPFLLEASGSPNSYHVWILLKPTKTINAYRFSRQIASQAGVECEVFPKQKGLTKNSKYGNPVKVPTGINRKTGVRSQFLDPNTFQPYPNLVPIPGIVRLKDLPEPEANPRARRPYEVESKRVPTRIGQDLRYCLLSVIAARISLEGAEGHEMRVAIASEAWNIGLSIDQAIEFFRHQPDFDAGVSRRKIEEIYSRCYRTYGCETLREKCGSFVSPYCPNCKSHAGSNN